jgi:multiple sugar transport system permease protein
MMKRRHTIRKVLSYIFLIISSFIVAYPVLFMVLGAFTTGDRFMETLILPIPNTLNLRLFRRGFEAVQGAYLITLIRVAFYEILTLASGIMGGYIFSKLRFPGRNRLFSLFLTGMLMPSIVLIVPMYLMMAWVPLAGGNNILGQGGHGFIGEWPVLFSFGWVSPFAVFLLKQGFDMLPTEYQEAARMDGAGIFTIIWNDYLWPSLTITSNYAFYPIAFQIQGIGGGPSSNYPAVMIRYLMAMWPPAALYFLLQRYFVQGLVASGLKG